MASIVWRSWLVFVWPHIVVIARIQDFSSVREELAFSIVLSMASLNEERQRSRFKDNEVPVMYGGLLAGQRFAPVNFVEDQRRFYRIRRGPGST